jgi:hypothetical protein
MAAMPSPRRSPRPWLGAARSRRAGEAADAPPLVSEADWARGGGGSGDAGDARATEATTLLGKRLPEDGPSFAAEIPAVVVTLLFNFMTSIPFGVAYFPSGWSNDAEGAYVPPGAVDPASGGGVSVAGPFPLPGREVLGIRMFLFACFPGQIVLALSSRFGSPVAVQLIENVPFYHALAGIVIAEQGYGREALSTLFFLFGLSSVVTGLMFCGLGKVSRWRGPYGRPSTGEALSLLAVASLPLPRPYVHIAHPPVVRDRPASGGSSTTSRATSWWASSAASASSSPSPRSGS